MYNNSSSQHLLNGHYIPGTVVCAARGLQYYVYTILQLRKLRCRVNFGTYIE